MKKKIFFIDEFTVKNNYYPQVLWAERGKPPKTNKSSNSEKASGIIVCDKNGFCMGKMFCGNINGSSFGAFILEVLANLKNENCDIKNTLFLMDNARIHTTDELVDLQKCANFFLSHLIALNLIFANKFWLC